MSAAPVRIVAPTGQPARVEKPKVAEVSALPSVWTLEDSIDWLVEDMIPRAGVNLISAESGTGKTWLAYAIAGAVAHGRHFIGRQVRQAPVVYLDGENPLYVVKRNLADLGVTQTDQLRVWGGWVDEERPRPNDARILQFAGDTKPLLIWDSLVEFARCDEQSSTEMREFMKLFRRLAHRGATVIVLHHTGKSKTSKDYRGSTDIKASVDMAYVVSGHARQGKLHRLEMNPFKSRIAPGEKFAMEFREGQGFHAIEAPKQGFNKPKVDAEEIVAQSFGRIRGSMVPRSRLWLRTAALESTWSRMPCSTTISWLNRALETRSCTPSGRTSLPVSRILEYRKLGKLKQNPTRIKHPSPATPVREEVYPSSPHTATLTGMWLEGSRAGKRTGIGRANESSEI